MALSNEEKQIIQFGKEQGKNKQDILNALGKFRAQKKPELPDDRITETGKDIKETILGAGREFMKSGEKIVETALNKDLTLGEKARGIGAAAFRGGSRAFGETIIGAGKIFLSQEQEQKVSDITKGISEKIGETEFVKNLVKNYETLPPDTKREIDNALGFAEGLSEIATGGAASRVIKPAIKTAAETAKELSQNVAKKITPQIVKDFQKGLNPKNLKEATDVMAGAYKKSFVADNITINKKLDKQARNLSFEGKKVNSDNLINDLVSEGIVPKVEGKLAKFDDAIDNLTSRQNRIAENINPVLKTIPTITPINEFKNASLKLLKTSPQIVENLPQAIRQLEAFFKSFEMKFGKNLSAEDINRIRIVMNSRTRAFGEETFKQDTANIVAEMARRKIDEFVPSKSVKQANEEWGRLKNIKETAEIFDNQPINIGVLGGALGRYMGVIGLSGVGFQAAGSGGLVIAGIAAKIGGDAVAQLLRNKKFIGKSREMLIQSIKRDEKVIQKLISEADEANKATLKRLFLPLPEKTAIPLGRKSASSIKEELSKSFIEIRQAKKGLVGQDPKTGRFFGTFRSD